MSSLVVEAEAMDVQLTDDCLSVDLSDGRTISVPLAWYPRLMHGTDAARNNWRFIGDNGEFTGLTLTKISAWRISCSARHRVKVSTPSSVGWSNVWWFSPN